MCVRYKLIKAVCMRASMIILRVDRAGKTTTNEMVKPYIKWYQSQGYVKNAHYLLSCRGNSTLFFFLSADPL